MWKQVFGVKLDCFLKNFESSFVSTLRTPRSNTKASAKTEVHSSSKCKEEKNPVDLTLDKKESYKTDTHVDDQLSLIEDVKESVSDSYTQELPLCKLRNDMVSFIPWPVGSYGNEIAVGAFERLVVENARSNDLKEREIDLKTQNLKLKETQMNLNCESNNLKAEKLKNQLENKRHSELLETCIDCLVAGLLIMCVALSYGAYVYSYHKIFEATAICTSSTQASVVLFSFYCLFCILLDLLLIYMTIFRVLSTYVMLKSTVNPTSDISTKYFEPSSMILCRCVFPSHFIPIKSIHLMNLL